MPRGLVGELLMPTGSLAGTQRLVTSTKDCFRAGESALVRLPPRASHTVDSSETESMVTNDAGSSTRSPENLKT